MNKLYKIQKGGYKINTEHKRLVFFLLDCSKVFFLFLMLVIMSLSVLQLVYVYV